MKSSSKSMPSASCWLSKWVGKRLQFLKRFCSLLPGALPSCWESAAATGGVHPASWTLQRGSTLAWIWNRMSSREFEKVVFVQFIMAQLLQKEEVSGVQQNPKTVPTETLPLLICFRKECSQGRRSAVCWALSASPSWGASSCLHLHVLKSFPQAGSGGPPWTTSKLLLILASAFISSLSPSHEHFWKQAQPMYYQCLLTSHSLCSAPTAVWPLPGPPRLPMTCWIQGHWFLPLVSAAVTLLTLSSSRNVFSSWLWLSGFSSYLFFNNPQFPQGILFSDPHFTCQYCSEFRPKILVFLFCVLTHLEQTSPRSSCHMYRVAY